MKIAILDKVSGVRLDLFGVISVNLICESIEGKDVKSYRFLLDDASVFIIAVTDVEFLIVRGK